MCFDDECCPKWDFEKLTSIVSITRCQSLYHRDLLARLQWVGLGLNNFTNGLRSFGHQGALYYVFLASDPLKTSREYAVFTLRTRGPKVCTRETSRQTQRVNAFFVLIAPNDRITSYIAGHWRPGQNFMMFQRTKNETWFSKNGNIKNLVKVQKWGRSRPIMYTYFCFVSFESCIIRSKYSSIAINKIWA